jgi:hypothetical protein
MPPKSTPSSPMFFSHSPYLLLGIIVDTKDAREPIASDASIINAKNHHRKEAIFFINT